MQWIIDLIKAWVIAYVAQETDLGANMPVGSIILWAGDFLDVPAGWRHCNGANGTPDFRGKFPMPAGAGFVPHAVGGALTHDHNFDWLHHHHIVGGIPLASGPTFSGETDSQGDANDQTAPASSLPPYYVLVYIMKLA